MKIIRCFCIPKTISYALVFFLFLFSSVVAAFSVGSWGSIPTSWITEPIHESITRDALAGLPTARLSNGQPISFSSQAVTEIADSNAYADKKYYSNRERHFDFELFDKGQSVLFGTRKSIVSGLRITAINGDYARRELGEALHTLQDFYAHSTWVENGLTSAAPLGQDIMISYSAPSSADLCKDHDIILPPSTQLTSGFYDDGNLRSGSNYYSWLVTLPPSPPIKKCSHGHGPVLAKCNDQPQCPAEDIDFNYSAGINKDYPGRRHHLTARIIATESTAEYVHQLILADFGNHAVDDFAKCELMGQDCYGMFLQRDGGGTGVITVSDPPANDVHQDCPLDCSQVLRAGTVVKLEAKADPGFEFLGWGQDCSAQGTTNPIQLTLSSEIRCKATFGVLPRVRLNPYGSKNLADGPFYLELVDATFAPTTTTEDVTVTFLRQVFSCIGLRFSSNRVVTIPKSQSYSSDLSGYVAGRDPLCSSTLPTRTELTITSAILGSSKALNLSGIPAAQRKVAITN